MYVLDISWCRIWLKANDVKSLILVAISNENNVVHLLVKLASVKATIPMHFLLVT